jgi:hypothetical protein
MTKRPNVIAVRVLLVLGCLLTVLAIFAVWAERQLLDTDQWVDTSTELIQNEEINTAIQQFLVDELFANVNVQGEIAKALPPQAVPLAGPLSGAVRQFADEIAGRALESSQFENAWAEANRAAHTLFLDVVEDRGQYVSTAGGTVTLDLRTLLTDLADRVGIPQSAVEKLPDSVGEIEILQSNEIDGAQKVVKLISGLAVLFSLLALGCLALAIGLARGYRSRTVFWAGLSLIIAGLLVVVVRNWAGNYVVENLVTTESVKAPAEAAWSISTSLMVSIAKTVIVYGILFGLAAWLGSSRLAAPTARRNLTPLLRDNGAWVYGALALVAIVYFLNAPTQSMRSFLTLLVLVLLAAAGIFGLRRRAIEENPGLGWQDTLPGVRALGAGVADQARARKDAMVARHAAAGESRTAPTAAVPAVAGVAAAPTPAPAPNPRLDELERLASLHDRGALTDEEFEREKTRTLEAV